MSDPTESGKSKFRLKAKSFVCVNAPQAESSAGPTSVHAMLEQNKTIAEAGSKPLAPPVKRSRRRKDYILAMIGGNAVMILAIAILPKNPVVLIFGFSGVVLYSVGITWVMWMVMDDY